MVGTTAVFSSTVVNVVSGGDTHKSITPCLMTGESSVMTIISFLFEFFIACLVFDELAFVLVCATLDGVGVELGSLFMDVEVIFLLGVFIPDFMLDACFDLTRLSFVGNGPNLFFICLFW